MVNFIGSDDLHYWASKARGNETIGVGIRPYGVHGGNMAPLIAYPYLACEVFKDVKKQDPKFKYTVWLNDIEPVRYVGHDGRRESADAANMYPGSTTFQHTAGPDGYRGSIVDYWQGAIEGIVRGTIGKAFPKVQLEFRRASELVTTPQFAGAVTACMERNNFIANEIEFSTGYRIKGPKEFVWPLCPTCHEPVTKARLERKFFGKITRVVGSHGKHPAFSLPIKKLDWATQFRILQTVRLATEQPDLWVIGLDHLPTNRTLLLESLAHNMGLAEYRGNFLHTPLLFADGDKKLGKSLGTAVHIAPGALIDALRDNDNPGLNMKYAPVSTEILAVGADLLPPYMLNDREEEKDVWPLNNKLICGREQRYYLLGTTPQARLGEERLAACSACRICDPDPGAGHARSSFDRISR